MIEMHGTGRVGDAMLTEDGDFFVTEDGEQLLEN